MTEYPIHIEWLPVNQAWLVMFGESRLAGPYNDRRDAEDYVADLERDDVPAHEDGWPIGACDACDRVGPLAHAGAGNAGNAEGSFCLNGCEPDATRGAS